MPNSIMGVPSISALNFKEDGIDWRNCSYVDKEYHRELYAKAHPRKGEILVVNIRAGCGASAIIVVDYEFSFKNIAILEFNKELIISDYLNYLLKWRSEEIYDSLTKGGFQPFLSLKILNLIHIPLPPQAEQIRIVKKLNNLSRFCKDLQIRVEERYNLNELLQLTTLKESLNANNEKIRRVLCQIMMISLKNVQKHHGLSSLFLRSISLFGLPF